MASDAQSPQKTCKALILVGGPSTGTRFRPLSFDLPKPLVPIAGAPMIHHHIHALANLAPHLTEIIILGFYQPALFNDFIATEIELLCHMLAPATDGTSDKSSASAPKIAIRYLQEPNHLGTAGGLHRYKQDIFSGDPDAVFVLHCDIGCDFPLKEMWNYHINSGKKATILAKRVDDEQALLYGQMVVDENTREIMHYAEKSRTKMSPIINCGVYLFSPDIFTYIDNVYEDFHRGNRYAPYSEENTEAIRLEQDVIMPLTGKGIFYAFETKSFWCQIKEPAAALVCSAMYLDHFKKTTQDTTINMLGSTSATGGLVSKTNSIESFARVKSSQKLHVVGANYIHPSAKVHHTAKIGPHACIGAGAQVGPGARLKNCIVLDDVVVKDHAVVRNAIIGWGSHVGYWTRVQGTATKPAIFGAGVTADSEIVVSNCVVLPHKTINSSCSDEIIL